MSQLRTQIDGSVKILILEDDPTIADIMGRMLKALKFQSVWVDTGEAAIKACQDAKTMNGFYDAALLDLTINGGLGGREAMKEMLKIDPEIKALACSGYSDDELTKELLAEGFAGILPKPFKAQDLGKTLNALLGR
jgi:CheY-like chemotaxis protein